VGLEQLRTQQRAQCATDEVAGDVPGIESVARLGAQGDHRVLVAHVHQLYRQVEHQHANQQGGERHLGEGQRYPGQHQGQQPHGGAQRALAAVGQAPGPVGGQGAGRTGQAEQPDHRIGVVVRLGCQQKRQGCPEQREQAERQQPQQRAQAQHRLIHEQAEHRTDQCGVFEPGVLVALGQGPGQGDGAQGHERSGQQVDAAPVTQGRHEPGSGARQQNAQQQAAHQRADHSPALGRVAQAGGHRHQYLRHHREQSGQGGADQQPHQAGGEGADQQADRGDGDHADDQAALFEQVTQRRQQQQAGAVAQLGGNHDAAGGGGGQAEMLSDAVQQGLRIVVAGHGQAGGGGHQQNQGAAQVSCGGGHGPSRCQGGRGVHYRKCASMTPMNRLDPINLLYRWKDEPQADRIRAGGGRYR